MNSHMAILHPHKFNSNLLHDLIICKIFECHKLCNFGTWSVWTWEGLTQLFILLINCNPHLNIWITSLLKNTYFWTYYRLVPSFLRFFFATVDQASFLAIFMKPYYWSIWQEFSFSSMSSFPIPNQTILPNNTDHQQLAHNHKQEVDITKYVHTLYYHDHIQPSIKNYLYVDRVILVQLVINHFVMINVNILFDYVPWSDQ